MKKLFTMLLVALAACTGTDTSPSVPTAPSRVVVVTDTAAKPAAPSNFAINIDSTVGTRAYLTVTWTDNSGGTAYTDLFDYYNGSPNNLANAVPGVSSLKTSFSKQTQTAFYLRTRRYINTIPGPVVYSAPVGPVTLFGKAGGKK